MKMNTINRTDLKHPKQHWIMTDKKQRRENKTEKERVGKEKVCCAKRCRKDHITNIQQDRRNTKNTIIILQKCYGNGTIHQPIVEGYKEYQREKNGTTNIV